MKILLPRDFRLLPGEVTWDNREFRFAVLDRATQINLHASTYEEKREFSAAFAHTCLAIRRAYMEIAAHAVGLKGEDSVAVRQKLAELGISAGNAEHWWYLRHRVGKTTLPYGGTLDVMVAWWNKDPRDCWRGERVRCLDDACREAHKLLPQTGRSYANLRATVVE